MVTIVSMPSPSLVITLMTFSYAEAPEIHAYFKGCAIRWDCMKYIKLGHRVVQAQWMEDLHKWDLKIENSETNQIITDQCDIVLSATGVLK